MWGAIDCQLANKQKLLSQYDPNVSVIQRGKSNGEVESSNNLWHDESRDGLIVDYLLEKTKTSDALQIEPAIKRLTETQSLLVTSLWGDRGLHRAATQQTLQTKGVYCGLCPRNVKEPVIYGSELDFMGEVPWHSQPSGHSSLPFSVFSGINN
jgi:hypothetical protein